MAAKLCCTTRFGIVVSPKRCRGNKLQPMQHTACLQQYLSISGKTRLVVRELAELITRSNISAVTWQAFTQNWENSINSALADDWSNKLAYEDATLATATCLCCSCGNNLNQSLLQHQVCCLCEALLSTPNNRCQITAAMIHAKPSNTHVQTAEQI